MKFTCFTLGVFYLAVASARPQESFHPEPPVQKRVGFRIDTREILEKIDEVNKKHGFIPKLQKEDSSKKLTEKGNEEVEKNSSRKLKGIFFGDVFANPILEYLKMNGGGNRVMTYSVEENGEKTNAEEENGIIKRKITHQQTIFVPQFTQNDYQLPLNGYQLPQNNFQFPSYYQQPGIFPVRKQDDLEGITVDNIKNIVRANYPENTNSPYFYNQPYYTTYYYPLPPGNYFKTSQNPRQATINMPFQEYFPIVIRNPFQMMFNAFTSMVEYGQGVSGNCKSDLREAKEKKLEEQLKDIERRELSQEEQLKDIERRELSREEQLKDIEGREISEEEQLESEEEEVVEGRKKKDERTKNGVFKPPSWFNNNKLSLQKTSTTPRPTDTSYDRLGEEDEVEDVVTNFSSSDKGLLNALHRRKATISRDNTGSGIFIHKLKVRKGGVAIAGPGGIATAGSGGTAIVGPNGLAFTHPDSLAIAGSGTKVVAVDPSINLSDLVNNRTRYDGSSPRVGKVVATGPVIYYNRG